jgi:hypothetical protein
MHESFVPGTYLKTAWIPEPGSRDFHTSWGPRWTSPLWASGAPITEAVLEQVQANLRAGRSWDQRSAP